MSIKKTALRVYDSLEGDDIESLVVSMHKYISDYTEYNDILWNGRANTYSIFEKDVDNDVIDALERHVSVCATLYTMMMTLAMVKERFTFKNRKKGLRIAISTTWENNWNRYGMREIIILKGVWS